LKFFAAGHQNFVHGILYQNNIKHILKIDGRKGTGYLNFAGNGGATIEQAVFAGQQHQ
jgi:hypothetical protein